MNDEFTNQVFWSFETNPIPLCSRCGDKPALVLKMLDPQNGGTLRMFRCRDCGEQT